MRDGQVCAPERHILRQHHTGDHVFFIEARPISIALGHFHGPRAYRACSWRGGSAGRRVTSRHFMPSRDDRFLPIIKLATYPPPMAAFER